MTKFKHWLCTNFLPDYCRVEMQDENKRLVELIQRQKQEIDRLNAYINGLESGIRSQRRIVIRNEVGNTTPGQTIDRSLLALYLNTGTSAAPEWHIIGTRVEDSSLEMDWGQETKTDILRNTYTTQKKPVKTQTFDPCELDAGDPAQVMLWNLAIKDENAAALCALDMLVAHLYVDVGASGAKFAVRNSACAISPTSLGGAGGGFLGMPLDVTLGGPRTVGSVTTGAEITFTPEGSGD